MSCRKIASEWFVDDELVLAGKYITYLVTSALVDSAVGLEIRYRGEAGVDAIQVNLNDPTLCAVAIAGAAKQGTLLQVVKKLE